MLPTTDDADSDQRGQALQMKRKRQRVGQTEDEASVPIKATLREINWSPVDRMVLLPDSA